MRKRFLSILTALALALSLLPVTALAAEGDGKITSDTATITQSGSYSIDSDVTLTNILTVAEGATVTLDLGGTWADTPSAARAATSL